jgi:hypothetical protein
MTCVLTLTRSVHAVSDQHCAPPQPSCIVHRAPLLTVRHLICLQHVCLSNGMSLRQALPQERIRHGSFSCCRCLAGDLHCLTSMPSRFKQLCISSTCNEIHSNHLMSIKTGSEHLGMLSMTCLYMLSASVSHNGTPACCSGPARCRHVPAMQCSTLDTELQPVGRSAPSTFPTAAPAHFPVQCQAGNTLQGSPHLSTSNFAGMITAGDARLELSAAVGVAAVGLDTRPISFVLRPQALPQVLPLRFRQVTSAAGERPHAVCFTYCSSVLSYGLSYSEPAIAAPPPARGATSFVVNCEAVIDVTSRSGTHSEETSACGEANMRLRRCLWMVSHVPAGKLCLGVGGRKFRACCVCCDCCKSIAWLSCATLSSPILYKRSYGSHAGLLTHRNGEHFP